MLEEFSLTHVRKNLGMVLSGGERRRTEIARALAVDPKFVLLDEPFAGIDPIAVGDIQDLVRHLKQRGIGVLITDHNVRETLGLIGAGNIGSIVADRALGLKMKVVAYDPFVPAEVFKSLGVEQVDFEQLLAVSDYISVHCPLTPETKGLFGESAFKKMKNKAYLVNTARGPVVDEVALAKALDAGEIAGAGLDVMTTEPPVGSPLLGNKKAIITPHTSFYSEESLVDLQTKAAQEVANVLTGKPARNPVNQVAK